MTCRTMNCLFKEAREEMIRDENLKMIRDIFDANFVDDVKIPFTRLRQRYSSQIVDGEYMRITVKLFEGDKERATYTEIVSSTSEAKKVVDKIHKAIDKIAIRYIVIEKRENRPAAVRNDSIRKERQDNLEDILVEESRKSVNEIKNWIDKEYPGSSIEIVEFVNENSHRRYSIRGYVIVDGFTIELPSVDSKGKPFIYDGGGYEALKKYIGVKLKKKRCEYNAQVDKYLKNKKLFEFHEDGTFTVL